MPTRSFGTAAVFAMTCVAAFAAACGGSQTGDPLYTGTNSYAIAGAFAAAAGALTVAQEVAASQPSPGSCENATCGGCCDAHQVCRPGGSDSACGAGGGACNDCTQSDATCSGGACVSGDGTAVGSAPPAANPPACDVASCPKCAAGSPCCSTAGTCTCSIGNFCL